MKKFILTILIIAMFPVAVIAEIVPHKVYAVSHCDVMAESMYEGQNISFQSLDRYFVSETEYVEKDGIITVRLDKYVEPKRGQRNGYLKIKLVEYTIPSENNKIKNVEDMDIYGTLRLSEKKDRKEIAKSAGVAITGHILKVPGFSQAVAVSKGIIKPNPDQNRLQSAGRNLYQSTPLKYSEKGQEINIEKDAIVVLRLKTKENPEE